MDALFSGTLIAHELWGMALRGEDEQIVQVIWPAGYGARPVGDRYELLDARGQRLALTGDVVEVGGGFVGDEVWYGCGGVRVTRPADEN